MCLFVHHKSHMTWPGLEAGDWAPELWHSLPLPLPPWVKAVGDPAVSVSFLFFNPSKSKIPKDDLGGGGGGGVKNFNVI
jgi:hypothetical protein